MKHKSYQIFKTDGFCFERIYEKKQYISFLKWRIVFTDREFYSDGQLKSEKKFEERDAILFLKSGHLIRVDKWTVYHSNGKLKSEKNYKNNKLNGDYKTYNLDGKLSLEGNYKEGKKDGVFRKYNINGQLSEEADYKNNKIIGSIKLHNSSDEKIKPSNLKKVWSKELLIGPPGQILLAVETELQNVELWNYFYKGKPFNGIVYYLKNQDEIFMLPPKNERIIDFQIELKNGIKDGKETGFYKNGKVQYTLYWEKGVRHGTETGFYKNGNIEYEKTFKNGTELLELKHLTHLFKNENNDLPKWFKGELNEKGWMATNSTTGKSYELNNIEGTMFEHLITVTTLYDMAQLSEEKNQFKIEIKKFHNWFNINNPEAYKILIDSNPSFKIKNPNKKELRKEYYETNDNLIKLYKKSLKEFNERMQNIVNHMTSDKHIENLVKGIKNDMEKEIERLKKNNDETKD